MVILFSPSRASRASDYPVSFLSYDLFVSFFPFNGLIKYTTMGMPVYACYAATKKQSHFRT